MKRIGDSGKTLLVVGGESSSLESRVRNVVAGNQGIKFEWASDLASAVERLAHPGIDVVLMEMNLPDAYGVTAFERLLVLSADTPIVVVASPGEDGVAARCASLGAQDWLHLHEVTPELLPRVLRYAIERSRLLGALCDLAAVDELTELYSRKGLVDLGQQALRSARLKAQDVLLIHLDFDGIQAINQNLGHDTGDEVLLATASILMDVFRSSDLVARVGPDEFAVLAVEAGEAVGETLFRRFMSAVGELETQNRAPCALRYTAGFAGLTEFPDASVEDLLIRAEADNQRRQEANSADRSTA